MSISDFGRPALGACAGFVLLSGCGGGSVAPNPSQAGPLAGLGVTKAQRTYVSPAYGVIYSFKGGTGDGANPDAGLIEVNGTLYSTTKYGGGGCYGQGCGTTFASKTTGNEALLSSFDQKNGAAPQSHLLNVHSGPFADGLYGTTGNGGTGCDGDGCGTVFNVTTSGKETVVYRFKGGNDGEYPNDGVVEVNGTLYGTTSHGGDSCSQGFDGCGTVFKIAKSGTETVLYRYYWRQGRDTTKRGPDQCGRHAIWHDQWRRRKWMLLHGLRNGLRGHDVGQGSSSL